MSSVPKLRATMLGASTSGKTTFMLGMYNIMRAGVDEYFLHAEERDHDLRLKHQWQALRNREQRSWPAPNDQAVQYHDFVFRREVERLIDIRWIDYRGGALDSPDDEQNPDVKSLISFINDSHCLFCVIDGEQLSRPLDNDRLLDVRDATLCVEMQHFLLRREKPLPVGIIITKADLCRPRHADGEVLMSMLLDEVRQLFPLLFREGRKFKVMVCPLTLGMGLRQDAEHALIHPEFVHLPLLFAIQSLFESESDEHRRQRDAAQARGDRAAGELNALQSSLLARVFRGKAIQESRDRLESEQSARQRAERAAHHAELQAASLARGLERVAIFYDGKRIQR